MSQTPGGWRSPRRWRAVRGTGECNAEARRTQRDAVGEGVSSFCVTSAFFAPLRLIGTLSIGERSGRTAGAPSAAPVASALPNAPAAAWRATTLIAVDANPRLAATNSSAIPEGANNGEWRGRREFGPFRAGDVLARLTVGWRPRLFTFGPAGAANVSKALDNRARGWASLMGVLENTVALQRPPQASSVRSEMCIASTRNTEPSPVGARCDIALLRSLRRF